LDSSAIFYNGQVSKGFEASVSFVNNQIVIEYYNFDIAETTTWKLTDIQRIDVFSENKIIITYNSKPSQVLEFKNNQFLSTYLSSYPKGKNIVKNHDVSTKKSVSKVLLLGIVFILFVAGFYFMLLPYLAEKVAGNISEKSEIRLGESIYKSVLQNYEVDSARTRLSQEFFQNLHFDKSNSVKITVVKSKEVNAFALPGKNIVVYDSIIKLMSQPNEYAALLAHEYSHIKFRHSLKSISRRLAGSLFISLVLGDVNGSFATIANNADAIRGLQYSRELEKQADTEAIKLMVSNNIDPHGMMKLFKSLEKTTKGKGIGSEFLSTHPLFKTRFAYISETISQQPKFQEDTSVVMVVWRKIQTNK